jgi:outer membrane protein TolC
VVALRDNPDLRAARTKHGVAEAQLLQAGILPNPSLSGAFLPLLSGVGSVPAWNIAISQDIRSLITYRSRQRSARDIVRQIDAELLWQEWQIAGQARKDAVDIIEGERARQFLEAAYALLVQRDTVNRQALAAGNATLATVAPMTASLNAVRTTLNASRQSQLALRHHLNSLLGLAPDVELALARKTDLAPLDGAAIRASLVTLPNRRPDLVALQYGYQAQEEAVRQAVLLQFPNLVLGAAANSDNASVINAGPQATIGLPIFDRNQGGIAIARALRTQLRAEYAARLANVTGEVGALLSEAEQLSRQLDVARRDLPAAQLAADRASAAFAASLLDERSYVDLITNRYSREQAVLTLETGLLDRQVAILTLTGMGLPTVESVPHSNGDGT